MCLDPIFHLRSFFQVCSSAPPPSGQVRPLLLWVCLRWQQGCRGEGGRSLQGRPVLLLRGRVCRHVSSAPRLRRADFQGFQELRQQGPVSADPVSPSAHHPQHLAQKDVRFLEREMPILIVFHWVQFKMVLICVLSEKPHNYALHPVSQEFLFETHVCRQHSSDWPGLSRFFQGRLRNAFLRDMWCAGDRDCKN